MFEFYFNSKTSEAMWLYTVLLLIVPFIGGIFQNRRGKKRLFFISYLSSFFILWYFFALSSAGTDYWHYIDMFYRYTTFKDIDSSEIEIGYQLTCLLVWKVTEDPIIGLAIIKSLQLMLAYFVIYKIGREHSLYILLLAYVALVYPTSFNVIRLAIAWPFVALCFYLFYKGKRSCWLFAFLAYAFHRSSLLFIIFLPFLSLFEKRGKKTPILFYIMLFAALTFLIVNYSMYFTEMMIQNEFAEGRYDNYLQDIHHEASFGLGPIIIFGPYFLLLYFFRGFYSSSEEVKRLWILSLYMGVCGLGIYLLGYQLSIISRANTFYVIPMMFFASYTYSLSTNGSKGVKSYHTDVLFTFIFVYWVMRFLLSTNVLMNDAGIDELMWIKL